MIQLLDANPKKILDDMLSQVGEPLEEGDRRYIFLSHLAYIFSVYAAKLNLSFNQNFLESAYSIGLDTFGRDLRTDRLQPTKASTTVRFTFSKPLDNDEEIPKGTAITTSKQQIFETIKTVIVRQGETQVDILCESQIGGLEYNNIPIGGLNILVNPKKYIKSVSNLTVTSGGTSVEADEDYRERLKIASSKDSSAGSVLSYKAWTLEADSNIVDAVIEAREEEAGTVRIKPILKGGEPPQEINLQRVRDMFDKNKNYPNTTKIIVESPDRFTFNIDLSYTISTENRTRETEIKKLVESAIDDFIQYQKIHVNIFLNPDDLRKRILNAGAYTVEITEPRFDRNSAGKINILGTKQINYGGLL